MAEIGTFTPEQARLLWQDYQTRQQLNPDITQNLPQRRMTAERATVRLWVIMDEDLFAFDPTVSDAPEATASVQGIDADGVMFDTGDDVTVVNRFENIAIEAGTLAAVEMLYGEWSPYKADCPTLSSSSGASGGGGGPVSTGPTP